VRDFCSGDHSYAVAGDLPGFGGLIDRSALQLLTTANMRRPVIAYTHKPVLDGEHPAAASNRLFITEAIEGGLMLNLSGNNPSHADALADLDLAPVVTILRNAYARRHRSLGRGKREWLETIGEYRDRISALPTHTPAGRRIAVCPASYTDTTCEACRACARHRSAVIGFPAHGGWRVVEKAHRCSRRQTGGAVELPRPQDAGRGSCRRDSASLTPSPSRSAGLEGRGVRHPGDDKWHSPPTSLGCAPSGVFVFR
jgi:hypothetical protein